MSRIPFIRHLRYRVLERLRHSFRTKSFIAEQAARLNVDESVIMILLRSGLSSQQIAGLSDEGPLPGAPENTTSPSISGTLTVGSTLSANQGSWKGITPITYAYQWKRGGTNISGATAKTYTLVEADLDANITVTVTAENSVGTSNKTSAARGPITAAE